MTDGKKPAGPQPAEGDDLATEAATGGEGKASSAHPVTPEGAEALAGNPTAPAIGGDGILRINLALQGGGAHGAYTWGVLDRLLEEEGIEIAAISGCSAGAMNGAALKSGWVEGGREGARHMLDWLWGQMGAIPDLSFLHWMMAFLPGPAITAKMIEAAVPMSVIDAVTSAFSPYDIPFAENPLIRVVERFSFDTIRCHDGPRLYVSATNVRTGKIRVFGEHEVTPETLLASACLPTLFRAIEIDDPATGKSEAYWDGGYAGNPALFPLFDPDLPDDIVIVNINPLMRDDLPRSAQEITNRINEISFNSSLLRELRAIGFVKRLIEKGQVPRGSMKDVRVHMIADDELMRSLSVTTKLVPAPTLLAQLKAAGRASAENFLGETRDSLGRAGSVDLATMLG
ncbi:patatin-like phospholipase family protein [Frigidibacter oleivorans]|uniref:patatin-like phospholipase family protein n=1 Tax=Frigidibacter oleivorans TaxID=2487129 RepID=UPI000F8F824F|nr:patatin-like phospholipase family protein [Frigidibacter oleivorans]